MSHSSEQLQQLEEDLYQHFRKVEKADGLEEKLEVLAEGAAGVSQAVVSMGDHSLSVLEEKNKSLAPEDEAFHFLVTFAWSEQAKNYLILWRDVLFQLQKAALLTADGRTSKEALVQLRKDSVEVLKEASDALIAYLHTEGEVFVELRQNLSKELFRWRLQQNPWPVYKKQLQELPEQSFRLQQDQQIWTSTAHHFQQIRDLILDNIASCQEEVAESKRAVKQIIDQIDTASTERMLNKVANQLEDVEQEVVIKTHGNLFSDELEILMAELPEKKSVVIEPDEGVLKVLDLNVRRKVQQWLESQALPLMYEIWELTENNSNGMKMTLVNSRNRAVLLSKENQDQPMPEMESRELLQPLNSFMGTFNDLEHHLQELQGLITQRLQAEFKASAIYDQKRNFLPVTLRSTVRKFQFGQNKLLQGFQKWASSRVRDVLQLKESVEQGANLSHSERVVRFILSRKGDVINSHYSSIFLTRGYVGHSFIVGRKEELAHANKVVQNWEDGYRGALVITGQRFAGKTLFAEMLALQHFPKNTLHLSPTQALNIKGRKLEPTYDLGKALKFVRKYSLNTRSLVLIDDLELWWTPEIPLYQNVRKLIHHIDQYSGSQFFIVTVGNALYHHLCESHDWERVFQARLSMDYMTANEIEEAILIRHGATHKLLINDRDEEASRREFKKICKKIYQVARGNIGEALNLWGHAVEKVDDAHVINCFPNRTKYELPPFREPESNLLLASIMMQKRTNEYRLRKLFGPAFQDTYSQALLRMIRVGILNRQLDGWLEIEEAVVNELGPMLEGQTYLKYN
jgi:hypothetical protein